MKLKIIALTLSIFCAMGAGFNLCKSDSMLLPFLFTVDALAWGWVALGEPAIRWKEGK